MKSVLTSLLILLATSATLFAQIGSLYVDKSIRLTEQSKTQNIEIDVPEAATNLEISVNCGIHSGSIEAILLDPKGKNMGKLKLGIEGTDNKQTEDGKLSLMFNNPQKGTWMVKVIPNKTDGRLIISSVATLDSTNEK